MITFGLFNLLSLFFISCIDKTTSSTYSTTFDTEIEFKRNTHDFGQIVSKDTISTVFKIRNIGSNPLIIRCVKSSCGCTIPKWPNNSIKINGEDEIKVIYDANSSGRF